MNTTIQLGGVPEHFFYPWKKWFGDQTTRSAYGWTWCWTDFPGGSGAMIPELLEHRLDLAFLLTESAASALAKNAPLRPLSVFVESPLQWGIFTAAQSGVEAVSPLENKRFAISRPGSGSELMAKVDARLRGETLCPEPWVVVGNLDGARKALAAGEADLFMWERWTTQHLVNTGEFRRVDIRVSPWASFVLVAGPSFPEAALPALQKIWAEVLALAAEIRKNGLPELARRYKMAEEEAESWLESVRWAESWVEPGPELEKAKPWFIGE